MPIRPSISRFLAPNPQTTNQLSCIPAMGSGTLVPRQIDIREIGGRIVRASGINLNMPP